MCVPSRNQGQRRPWPLAGINCSISGATGQSSLQSSTDQHHHARSLGQTGQTREGELRVLPSWAPLWHGISLAPRFRWDGIIGASGLRGDGPLLSGRVAEYALPGIPSSSPPVCLKQCGNACRAQFRVALDLSVPARSAVLCRLVFHRSRTLSRSGRQPAVHHQLGARDVA